MLRLQNTNEKNRIREESPEVVEISDGMRQFLKLVAKRMLEKDIKEYYSSDQKWEHSCPPSKAQSI
ncbi:MAG: hypothetical protein IPJ69_03835 [Deltaproteobacteria bacterium]|nr:MAG: hypothetical protein IPJ69_03835 [Deltaproteobacteria bacterium]